MNPKNSIGNFNLSNSDIDAILCALPLVLEIGADTEAQCELNAVCCASASNKLAHHISTLTPNETRVIAVAVAAALYILSGKVNDFMPDIDNKWKADLSRYFFTYNRLNPLFQDFLEQFHT